MKVFNCLLISFLISFNTFADQKFLYKGRCFVVDGKNITKPCLVSESGSAERYQTTLILPDASYYILQEKITVPDGEDLTYSLGEKSDELLEAEIYPRDFKTKKVSKDYKNDAWSCIKQVKGKLDICQTVK